MTIGIAAPKPDLDTKAKKRRLWNTFKKGLLKGKLLFTLHTSRFTLHTSHFTLQEHDQEQLLLSLSLPLALSWWLLLLSLLLSPKNMTCARPQCNATSSKHFPHTSHCTLHSPHSTLHTCTSSQLISSELFSSHFMFSHMSAKFFLAIFMWSDRAAQTFSSHRG